VFGIVIILFFVEWTVFLELSVIGNNLSALEVGVRYAAYTLPSLDPTS